MKALAAFPLAFALIGSIALTHSPGTTSASMSAVEVGLGALASGSTGGANRTEGVASLVGSLVSLRTDVLYLNNTNTTGIWYARLASAGTTGISNIVSVTVGIDNGTASSAQVTGALGALTQTTGTAVRLEPASANVVYVTQAVSVLGPDTAIALEIVVSDATDEEATFTTNANVTIT